MPQFLSRRGGPSGLATPIFSLSSLEPKSLRMVNNHISPSVVCVINRQNIILKYGMRGHFCYIHHGKGRLGAPRRCERDTCPRERKPDAGHEFIPYATISPFSALYAYVTTMHQPFCSIFPSGCGVARNVPSSIQSNLVNIHIHPINPTNSRRASSSTTTPVRKWR